MTNRITRIFFSAIVSMVLSATVTSEAFGQRGVGTVGPLGTTSTAVAPAFPHDFSDRYYKINGVDSSTIKGRLTGADFLSAIEETAHPDYSNVRALITLPAHTFPGQSAFWNPLGVVGADAYSELYSLASRHPIYVFPDETLYAQTADTSVAVFSNMRQAVIIDDASAGFMDEANPLSLRAVIRVNFLEPATKKAAMVLDEMGTANGRAADGRPVVLGVNDLNTLITHGLVDLRKEGLIAVAPIMNDSREAFAKDAFLSTVLVNGKPLEGELRFVNKFECLTGRTPCL